MSSAVENQINVKIDIWPLVRDINRLLTTLKSLMFQSNNNNNGYF